MPIDYESSSERAVFRASDFNRFVAEYRHTADIAARRAREHAREAIDRRILITTLPSDTNIAETTPRRMAQLAADVERAARIYESYRVEPLRPEGQGQPVPRPVPESVIDDTYPPRHPERKRTKAKQSKISLKLRELKEEAINAHY